MVLNHLKMCSGHFPATFKKSWLRKRQASRNGELPTKDFFQKILQGPPLPPPSTLKVLDSSMNHCQKAINNTLKLAGNTVASLGQDWFVPHSDILRNQTYCLSLTTFSGKWGHCLNTQRICWFSRGYILLALPSRDRLLTLEDLHTGNKVAVFQSGSLS